jgi:hypothetical protein
MDPSLFPNLPKSISSARLAPYLTARSGNLDQALRLSTWNIEASASLWGELHVFEIALRNAIHDHMILEVGKTDWWTDPQVKLTDFQFEMLGVATKKALKIATDKKRTLTPGDVIATSLFGFWTAFFGPEIKNETDPEFPPLLRAVFPNYANQKVDFTDDFNRIRDARNRIAHHEPIFSRFLIGDHNRILRIAGYIDSDIADYIKSHSRIVESLGRRDAAVIQGIATRF